MKLPVGVTDEISKNNTMINNNLWRPAEIFWSFEAQTPIFIQFLGQIKNTCTWVFPQAKEFWNFRTEEYDFLCENTRIFCFMAYQTHSYVGGLLFNEVWAFQLYFEKNSAGLIDHNSYRWTVISFDQLEL